MLSPNSGPWPIASSHQHQTNPYHALLYTTECTAAALLLCTLGCRSSVSLVPCSNSHSLVTSPHLIDVPRLSGRPGWLPAPPYLGTARYLACLPCPALNPEPLTRDTALTAWHRTPTR